MSDKTDDIIIPWSVRDSMNLKETLTSIDSRMGSLEKSVAQVLAAMAELEALRYRVFKLENNAIEDSDLEEVVKKIDGVEELTEVKFDKLITRISTLERKDSSNSGAIKIIGFVTLGLSTALWWILQTFFFKSPPAK